MIPASKGGQNRSLPMAKLPGQRYLPTSLQNASNSSKAYFPPVDQRSVH
jgi:hypothetical protein